MAQQTIKTTQGGVRPKELKARSNYKHCAWSRTVESATLVYQKLPKNTERAREEEETGMLNNIFRHYAV